MKSRSLIIGMGEIGTALYKVLNRSKIVYARDLTDTDHDAKDVDILHIAFPYSDGFVNELNNYIEQYDPVMTIVYSTTPIGTCESISPSIIHSPVEGRHPNLEDSILKSPRWLGSGDDLALDMAVQYWVPITKVIRTMGSSRFTEFLKLRSTSKYGVNLVWADYEKSVADKLKMDYGAIKDFDSDYNQLYKELNLPQFQRYILDPPEEGIGGHCLIENAVLLDQQYSTPLLKEFLSLGKNLNTIKDPKPYLNRAWLYAEYWGKEKSSEQIGREWGCTGANILRIMEGFDIKRRSKVWTDGELDLLVEMSATHTFKQISEAIGKTHDAVRLRAIQLGIKSIYDPGQRSKETRMKISASLQGITAEEWGGFKETTNQLVRKSEVYQQWRKEVFKRDDYTCQMCSVRGTVLHAHHIKGFAKNPELRFDLSNGQTLCVPCHEKTDNYKGKGRKK